MFRLSQQFTGRDYHAGQDLYDYEYGLVTAEDVEADTERLIAFFTPEAGVRLEYAE